MTGSENKYNAAASMLGYMYQCRQALLFSIDLSKNFPGLSISIERFDDIAVEDGKAPSQQVQLKHHIKPGALTDNSPDIWKTLRIWSEQVKANPQLPFETKFSIITTGTAAENSAPALLRQGSSSTEQDKARKQLEASATSSKNEETKSGRQAFMALSQQERTSLIAAIVVFDSAPNITDARAEIEDMLAFAVPTQHLHGLVDHLEGWWFDNVVRSLISSDAPPLSLLALRSKIDELAIAFKRDELILTPHIEAPPDAEQLAPDSRIFVQQMRRVGLGQSSVDGAKRDYYRATTQRSEWIRKNALLDGETQRYDDTLVDRWDREWLAQVEGVIFSSDDEKQAFGRTIFHWANRSQVPFRNRHEAWLTVGSYHVLAERVRVGWHPDFRDIFHLPEEEE
ncbi:hypothetical protein RM530_17680 [Algiphilus sp. W345]|uniref:ABC-three component systems C-terminal domain-containing protein n=1 Tax=Banduia mediterranea TaxID=3075609 RepID=A0ABU2WMS0_9GAMM|nr:ABC-three component system protein [Algiphilus sp. W345]MDT0499177.1 hypothetical protein [Algiphilus sp. W345]